MVLGGPTIDQDSMFKLILSGSQGLTICTPIGLWVKILGGYIEDMMKRGGVEGNFKNHSMRKSTCTRLFRKGVDPQLGCNAIQEIKLKAKKRSVRYVECFAKGNGGD